MTISKHLIISTFCLLTLFVSHNSFSQFKQIETEDVYGKIKVVKCIGNSIGNRDKEKDEAWLLIRKDNEGTEIAIWAGANPNSVYCLKYRLEIRFEGDKNIYSKEISGYNGDGINRFFIVEQNESDELQGWLDAFKKSTKVFLRIYKSEGYDSCTDDFHFSFDLGGSFKAITWIENQN